MNPNPSQIALIQGFVSAHGGWNQTDGQIRAAMTADLVSNPITSAPTIPKPYTALGIFGLLSAASAKNVLAYPGITDIFNAADMGDGARVLVAAQAFASTGLIASTEATAIESAINATEPDPTWTSTVSWDVANLGRVADDYDIEAARLTN